MRKRREERREMRHSAAPPRRGRTRRLGLTALALGLLGCLGVVGAGPAWAAPTGSVSSVTPAEGCPGDVVTITGNGHTVEALPIDRTTEILRRYGAVH